MHKGRKFDSEFKLEVAKIADEIGPRAASRRYDLSYPTVYGWLKNYKESRGITTRKVPNYTDAEIAVFRGCADDINCRLMRYRELAEKLYEVSGIMRNEKAVARQFFLLGLRDSKFSRRKIAEEIVYRPFLTVEERDAAFAAMDDEKERQKLEQYDPLYMSLDPVAEREIDKMLGGLVARLERGDGPRVYGQLREVA